jgi:hypothetical protein
MKKVIYSILRPLVIIIILVFHISLLNAQNRDNETTESNIQILLIETQYKTDSLMLEANKRISELNIQFSDSFHKIYLKANKKIVEIQRVYTTMMYEEQKKAERNPLFSNELDKDLQDLEIKLTSEIQDTEKHYTNAVSALEKKFEFLTNNIEKELELQVSLIEKQYELKIKQLESVSGKGE